MKQLEKVQNNTTWAKASNAINNNNDALYVAVTTLEHAAFKNKGYFKSVALLYDAYPTSENGAQAFVYNSSNPTSAPYDIYEWVNGAWQDTDVDGGNVNVNLDGKQDTLVGYSESVSGGKATQVAIQGDAIALSGKVSLGNVDDMESAILMSSSQAGAAIAKANTLEQSMSALKSPVKPLHLNSQGKLELNIGKGLYVDDGKLCTTGASGGGGGGGTTYSEGQGIIIQDDKISVAYDIDTLRVNDCGGLTVNYGEGLAIKDGKLSALTSVTAGNGLVKKGEELSVNISTGLQYGSDGELSVKTGKGLSVDNTGTINANIDNSTIATNSDGAMYVQKGMLAGQGLKVSLDRLAVNYGNGLTISNRALVVKHGTGLAVDSCGKLYSTAQGGKTYVGGQAVNVNGNEINVKYDGVTISTKDTADNSLHVMLGNGLKQGSNGIDVAVGSGLAIGGDNKLYATNSGGTTYTAGDGINISGEKISFKLGTSLESVCGYIQVAISSGLEYDPYNEYKIRVKAGDGITIPNTGEVKVSLGTGLTFGEFGAINICDSVLADIGNLKDSKQDKLTFGSGLTKSGCNVVLADHIVTDINNNRSDISALQTTVANIPTYSAGSGISIENNQISVSNAVQSAISSLRDSVKGKQDALEFGQGLSYGNGKLEVALDPYGGLYGCSNGIGINVDYTSPLLLCHGLLTMDVDNSVLNMCGGVLGIQLDSSLIKSCDGISVNIGNGLRTNNCGEVEVDLYNITNPTGGLLYENGLGVNVGNGLKINSCQVVVDYGTGMSVSNNKIYVDTSKIAGSGIDLDSDYKTLTIGTKAAKELAGKGLVADGRKMKVKYGSGLTTNTCGGLIVDAAKLTVSNANHASCADVAHGITYTRDGGQLTHGGDSYEWYNVYHSTIDTEGDAIILNLRHSFYWQKTTSVTFAINVGYGDVNITQLGATPDNYTYNKIRVRWVNGKEVFIDVFIKSSEALSDVHYVQGFGRGTFTPPIPTSDTTGIIGEFSIRSGYFYAQNVGADVFLGNLTGTADKAIADANGNDIAATYAEQFVPTYGLVINSDRQLSLPNLTSNLAGNAVDGSKNGAQRVLNLLCGAIQIKLSTGLAIDDNGYLYIQDKYVTK